MEKVFEFFKEMAEKHKTPINELNMHIDGGKIYVQKYTPGFTDKFKLLEIVELNP